MSDSDAIAPDDTIGEHHESTGGLELGEYVPYLLNRAGAKIAAAFTEVVRDYGLTLPMWRVMAVLRDDGPSRMRHISERTTIEVSTLSRAVDGLEKRSLVARRRETSDARSVRVALTQTGMDVTDRIIPIAKRYESTALSDLSDADEQAPAPQVVD